MGPWLCSVTGIVLIAQSASVAVVGTVRDAESGAPIAEAIVTFADPHRVEVTDERGRYRLDTSRGSRHVTVQRLGYTAQTFDALVPEHGTLEINIQLRRDPFLLPPIDVHATVPIRGLEQGTGVDFPDRTMSQAAMYQHPILSEPDALRALGGGEVVLNPESPSGLHIRSGASDQVAYLVDGIPVFSPYHSAGTFGAWNPDALSSVDLVTSSPLPAAPDALSGFVSANTRAPGSRLSTRGSISATQARAAIDGPVGRTGVGYVFSASSAFPGLLLHKDESSHLHGENFDWLGKVESPLLAGRLRLVGYGSRSKVDAAATLENDTSTVDPARNTLAWDSRTLGAEWRRSLRSASLVLRSWTAFGNSDAAWTVADSVDHLTSNRRDDGVVAMVEVPAGGGNTTAGVRAQRIETSYTLRPAAGESGSAAYSVQAPVATLFLEHARSITARGELGISLANAYFDGETYFSPSAQLRWRLSHSLVLSGTAARRHQFGQSLRNPESIVSNIFPADLYVAAGSSGVPVASSNLAIVALEHRPNSWLRVGAQAYIRDFGGLALVAPRGADPFATNGFVEGSGNAHGFALEAGASGERYGLVATYGFQSVDLEYAGGHYVPEYGATHSIEAGLTVFPVPSYSVRLGFESAFGRRTTASVGAMEWEACNLIDQGCEFVGSPLGWSEPLGYTELPAYFRLDLGVRKQWHMKFGGRDGRLVAFGTATNLLARKNVMTVAVDPYTGERSAVEMRPLSPLVVGIDWRF